MFQNLFQEIELNIRDTMSTDISGIMFWGGFFKNDEILMGSTA